MVIVVVVVVMLMRVGWWCSGVGCAVKSGDGDGCEDGLALRRVARWHGHDVHLIANLASALTL